MSTTDAVLCVLALCATAFLFYHVWTKEGGDTLPTTPPVDGPTPGPGPHEEPMPDLGNDEPVAELAPLTVEAPVAPVKKARRKPAPKSPTNPFE